MACLLIVPFFSFHRDTEYYDYGHGEAQETYESYSKTCSRLCNV